MLYKDNSHIHGNGLFTTEPFKKGEVIGTFQYVVGVYNTKFSLWLDREHLRITNKLKYANHSSSPNADVVFPKLVALQDIEAGSELTWFYCEEFL